jgi:hypothetical protein
LRPRDDCKSAALLIRKKDFHACYTYKCICQNPCLTANDLFRIILYKWPGIAVLVYIFSSQKLHFQAIHFIPEL